MFVFVTTLVIMDTIKRINNREAFFGPHPTPDIIKYHGPNRPRNINQVSWAPTKPSKLITAWVVLYTECIDSEEANY